MASVRDLVLVIRGRDEATRVLAGIGRHVNTLGDHGQNAALKFSLLGTAMTAAAAGGIRAMTGAVRAAADFEEGMRHAGTVLEDINETTGGTRENFDAMSKAVLRLSTVTTHSARQMADGLYFAASAGFRANDALKIAAQGAVLADAGFADMETTTRGLVVTLKAFGIDANHVGRVADVLFQTVKLGVPEFQELVDVLGKLVPTIGNVANGLPNADALLRDMGGSFAAMTLAGLGAAESATAFNRIVVDMIKPSDDLEAMLGRLGKTGGVDLIESFGGAGRAVLALNTAIGGNAASVVKLFPNIRAMRGFFALAANSGQNLAEVLQRMDEEAPGSTIEAFNERSRSLNFQLSTLGNTARALAIEFGQGLAPIVDDLAGFTQRLADAFAGMSDRWKETLIRVSALAVAFAGLKGFGFLARGVTGGFAANRAILRLEQEAFTKRQAADQDKLAAAMTRQVSATGRATQAFQAQASAMVQTSAAAATLATAVEKVAAAEARIPATGLDTRLRLVGMSTIDDQAMDAGRKQLKDLRKQYDEGIPPWIALAGAQDNRFLSEAQAERMVVGKMFRDEMLDAQAAEHALWKEKLRVIAGARTQLQIEEALTAEMVEQRMLAAQMFKNFVPVPGFGADINADMARVSKALDDRAVINQQVRGQQAWQRTLGDTVATARLNAPTSMQMNNALRTFSSLNPDAPYTVGVTRDLNDSIKTLRGEFERTQAAIDRRALPATKRMGLALREFGGQIGAVGKMAGSKLGKIGSKAMGGGLNALFAGQLGADLFGRESVAGQISSFAGFVGAGAITGSAFGPIGAGVGAGIGALVGGIAHFTSKSKEATVQAKMFSTTVNELATRAGVTSTEIIRVARGLNISQTAFAEMTEETKRLVIAQAQNVAEIAGRFGTASEDVVTAATAMAGGVNKSIEDIDVQAALERFKQISEFAEAFTSAAASEIALLPQLVNTSLQKQRGEFNIGDLLEFQGRQAQFFTSWETLAEGLMSRVFTIFDKEGPRVLQALQEAFVPSNAAFLEDLATASDKELKKFVRLYERAGDRVAAFNLAIQRGAAGLLAGTQTRATAAQLTSFLAVTKDVAAPDIANVIKESNASPRAIATAIVRAKLDPKSVDALVKELERRKIAVNVRPEINLAQRREFNALRDEAAGAIAGALIDAGRILELPGKAVDLRFVGKQAATSLVAGMIDERIAGRGIDAFVGLLKGLGVNSDVLQDVGFVFSEALNKGVIDNLRVDSIRQKLDEAGLSPQVIEYQIIPLISATAQGLVQQRLRVLTAQRLAVILPMLPKDILADAQISIDELARVREALIEAKLDPATAALVAGYLDVLTQERDVVIRPRVAPRSDRPYNDPVSPDGDDADAPQKTARERELERRNKQLERDMAALRAAQGPGDSYGFGAAAEAAQRQQEAAREIREALREAGDNLLARVRAIADTVRSAAQQFAQIFPDERFGNAPENKKKQLTRADVLLQAKKNRGKIRQFLSVVKQLREKLPKGIFTYLVEQGELTPDNLENLRLLTKMSTDERKQFVKLTRETIQATNRAAFIAGTVALPGTIRVRANGNVYQFRIDASGAVFATEKGYEDLAKKLAKYIDKELRKIRRNRGD